MHTNIFFSDDGKTRNSLHDRINNFACLQVRISGPWGAVRLSCLPVLLSHRHQDSSGVCCHVLTLTCVSILNKFPALAIKQPELGRALLWARAVQGRKRLTALPTTSFTSLLSSHRLRCLSPCQSMDPAPFNHLAPALDQKANGKAFGNFQLILAGNEWLTKEKIHCRFLCNQRSSKAHTGTCGEVFHHLTGNSPGARLLTASLFLFRKADLKAINIVTSGEARLSGKCISLKVSGYRRKEPSPLPLASLQQPPVLTSSSFLSCAAFGCQTSAICKAAL